MTSLFLTLLNRSITAGWLILAVMGLRILLKKAPRTIIAAMWGLVGFRLLFPFSIESLFSLVPSTETIPHDILYSSLPVIRSGIPSLNTAVNPVLTKFLAPGAEDSIYPAQRILFIASIVWLIGMMILLLYMAVSYLLLCKKVREGIPLSDNLWICDRADTPFILGLIHPRICLPSTIAEQDMDYVIAHEKAHLKRRDHIWKALGFFLLAVYWFHPLVWAAYVLFCKDIEFACDEKVLNEIGQDCRKSYSNTLINCSSPHRILTASPLAFGEVGVKDRVQSVLRYKKPTMKIIAAALLSCMAAALCFFTNPSTSLDERLMVFLDCAIASHHESPYSADYFRCLNYQVLGKEKHGEETSIYMWVLYEEYSNENGLTAECGAHIPTVITVKKNQGQYELKEYWEPRDGSYYAEDIREKFPIYLWSRALDSQRYIKEQSYLCEQAARNYFATEEPH